MSAWGRRDYYLVLLPGRHQSNKSVVLLCLTLFLFLSFTHIHTHTLCKCSGLCSRADWSSRLAASGLHLLPLPHLRVLDSVMSDRLITNSDSWWCNRRLSPALRCLVELMSSNTPPAQRTCSDASGLLTSRWEMNSLGDFVHLFHFLLSRRWWSEEEEELFTDRIISIYSLI